MPPAEPTQSSPQTGELAAEISLWGTDPSTPTLAIYGGVTRSQPGLEELQDCTGSGFSLLTFLGLEGKGYESQAHETGN